MSQKPSTKAEPSAVTAAQSRLLECASTLGTLSGQLHEIIKSLPVSPGEEDMLNDLTPKDVPTEIAGALEYLTAECLEPARESLEQLARVSAEDLRREFQEARERDGQPVLAAPEARMAAKMKTVSVEEIEPRLLQPLRELLDQGSMVITDGDEPYAVVLRVPATDDPGILALSRNPAFWKLYDKVLAGAEKEGWTVLDLFDDE
jgi:hypothetical protein